MQQSFERQRIVTLRPVIRHKAPADESAFLPKCRRDRVVPNALLCSGRGWPEFSFCGACGKPIIAFLKKRKLLANGAPNAVKPREKP